MKFNLRQYKKPTIQYLKNHLLIPFKDLKFKLEMLCDYGSETEFVLSVTILEQEYEVRDKVIGNYITQSLHSNKIETICNMLFKLENQILLSKVIIPSKSNDYYEIINRIFNSKYATQL